MPGSRSPKTKRASVIDDTKLRNIAVKLRKAHNCGAPALAAYLRDDYGYHLSASTAKRLLASLMKEGRIAPLRAGKNKKPLCGKAKHAQPASLLSALAYKRAVAALLSPGGRVQMDTMFVRYNGGYLAVLAAIDVRTRMAWWHPVHALTSHAASVLLREVHADLQRFGFGGVDTVQVDRGAEFLGDFVAVAEELDIKRMVNPRGNPKCNAYAESLHGTARRECLNDLLRTATAAQIRAALSKYERFYNTKRYHSSLGGLSLIMEMKRLLPQSRQKCNM